MARITYTQFKKHLEREGFYSAREILHLFHAVKQMDKESRGWVIAWFEDGTYPEKAVEQITVRELVEDFGYKPLNAFIAIDWLKHDPQAAKYFIVKSVTAIAETEARRAKMSTQQFEQEQPAEPQVGLNTTDAGDIIEA